MKQSKEQAQIVLEDLIPGLHPAGYSEWVGMSWTEWALMVLRIVFIPRMLNKKQEFFSCVTGRVVDRSLQCCVLQQKGF